MRGAGSCFGIVTRFELKTFEMGKIWGGTRTYAHEHETAVFDSFDTFVQTGAVANALAQAYIIGTDAAKDGTYIYSVTMSHGSPEEPPVFDDFKQLTPLESTTQTRTLKDLCDELDTHMEAGIRYLSIDGKEKYPMSKELMEFLRYHILALSIKYDRETLKEIIDLYAEGAMLLKDQDDFAPAFVCQPLLPSMLPKDDIGNPMGIKPEDGPLICKLGLCTLTLDICVLTHHTIVFTPVWRWTEKKHDEAILKAANIFEEKAEKAAQSRGKFHRYRVLNYSTAHQDVYGGYGEENRKRLLEIRDKYDPDDIMSKLRPGIIQLLP